MAISKITTRGISGDTLEAGDIAANAVGASELADNAVDTAAIAANAVTNAKIPDDLIQVKPHIKPGILQPAYQGHLTGKSNPVVDSSDSAHAVINTDYVINNGDPKVGVGYLNDNGITGSGGSFLKIGDDNDADFQFGTGAFTIEYWVKEDDYDYGDHGHMTTSQGAVGWAVQRNSTYIYFTAQGDAYGSAPTSGNKIIARANLSGHVSNNTWYHVAIVRVSTSNLKIYINGIDRTAEADAGGTYGFAFNNTSNDTELVLGRSYPTSSEKHTVGGFDAVRITKGLAVYTGNFTAPTANLTTTWSAGTNIAANSTASNVKLLLNANGETNGLHSGAYGTAQSDGRNYYYTDIKGSKPLKDPRIGGYFGSQRHKFKSMQLLEQETATHGSNVYSIDGREWIRGVGGWSHWSDSATSGGVISSTQNDFFEITGYFSSANYIAYTDQHDRSVRATIDGGSESGTSIGGANSTSFGSPLDSRYVDAGSMHQLTSTTLGIHTIKIRKQGTASTTAVNGIELIAQDTSSTANRSKVQIPSQNVVSYGKKFTVSGTPHYNPFDGLSGAKTLTELGTYIDTATSLGMENWKGGTANYYKPFNGGRVVKWVDSSGVIKTSVNMMPPNAQNINTTASNAFSDGEVQAGTNNHTITFNGSAVDHSLSEVAKTFHWREFGNGSANGGTGSSSYPDLSMLSGTADNIAYAMDDGLTNFTGSGVKNNGGPLLPDATNDHYFITFIGTGIGYIEDVTQKKSATVAQNLPYGTHILKVLRDADTTPDLTIDGVAITDVSGSLPTTGEINQITFHQPKKPPIPEDACILADYMLMADYVKQTTGTPGHISKGVRRNSITRDFVIDTSAGNWGSAPLMKMDVSFTGGFSIYNSGNQSADVSFVQLPSFATRIDALGFADRRQIYVDSGSAEGQTVNGSTYDAVATMNTAKDLGLYTFKAKNKATTNGNFTAFDIANPIHTSSHYQSFETPYLHELVGGDRNMEQTNLVVTSDGKTWDQVTRDTSYIGKTVMQITRDGGDITSSDDFIFDLLRGLSNLKPCIDKENFVNAFDRQICLVDGEYQVNWDGVSRTGATQGQSVLKLNGTDLRIAEFGPSAGRGQADARFTLTLKRGDYLNVGGDDLEGNQSQFLCYLRIDKV